MKTEQPNGAIFSFAGRSNSGMRDYSIAGEKCGIGRFLASFSRDCTDLDYCNPSVVQNFLSLAVKPVPAELYNTDKEDFLLTAESIRGWFSYWKNLEIPFPVYMKDRFVHVAVYAVRYCMTIHPERNTLRPELASMIRGKEFTTFILKEWTGNGLVGIATTSDGNRTVVKEFSFSNRQLARIYCDYFEGGIATVRVSEFSCFSPFFEDSLGALAANIHGYADFSEGSLLQQATFFRNKYLHNPQMQRKALRHVVGFYRYLIATEEGSQIFTEGNFSARLLKSMSVIRYLAEGWEFVNFKSIDQNEKRTRLIVILKDMRGLGTRYLSGDAIAVDMSRIQSEYYRNVLWRYLRANQSAMLNHTNLTYIVDSLHDLETNKGTQPHKLTVLTTTDTRCCHAKILDKSIQDQTVNTILSSMRTFFTWTTRQRLIVAENDIAIQILRYREKRNAPSFQTKAIPREDCYRILGRLAMEAERSYRNKIIFTVVNLMATTSFRPSQICHMDIRTIQLSHSKSYCVITGVSKTSKADKQKSIVHPEAYEWLSSLITESAEMRDRCYDQDIRNMVFLYEGTNGFTVIREADLKQELERVCDILELPHWTPYSFRRMHATVWDELDRALGHHGEIAALGMGHKSYDTTRKHYIDRSFREFRRVNGAALISTDEQMKQEFDTLCKTGRI